MVLRCAIRKAEPLEQRDYVRRLLEAYRTTPDTSGAVRRPDRLLAAQLYQRGVPLEAVENALTLAAARRLARAADAPPMRRRSASSARWRTSRPSLKRSCISRWVPSTSAICAIASQDSRRPRSFAPSDRIHACGVDDATSSLHLYHLRAYGADDDARTRPQSCS